MREQTDWFDLPADSRSIHCKYDDVSIAKNTDCCREWWLCESLQRYYLLCICMDTAVKMANIGAITGWIKDVDVRRKTAQMLVMNFEPINAAVERLNRIR